MTTSRITALPQTEAQWQAAIIQYAQANGWKVAHFGDSRRQVRDRHTGSYRLVGDPQARGFPDLVCVRDRVIYAEIKGRTTRVTAEQLAWGQLLLNAGQEWYLWRAGAPGVWDEIERALGRRRALQTNHR